MASYLCWKGGFERFPLIRIATDGDGSCFFHAVLAGFFVPYREQMLNDRPTSRREIALGLRIVLADNFDLETYKSLGNGHLEEFSKSDPNYSYDNLKRLLKSNLPIGNEFIEYISNRLDKDIYLLDIIRQNIYSQACDISLLYKGRKSVVLLYLPGHYELIGLRREDGSIATHFDPEHELIQFLKSLQ